MQLVLFIFAFVLFAVAAVPFVASRQVSLMCVGLALFVAAVAWPLIA